MGCHCLLHLINGTVYVLAALGLSAIHRLSLVVAYGCLLEEAPLVVEHWL